MILRVKVNKQLDGKANGIIESCQEIISELCSIQEWGDFTWRVSDCEELVEDLFREERGNDLQRDLREMMRLVEP